MRPMGDDDEEMRALAAQAARAAPATSSGTHVSDFELARMRRDDEDASLDDAYRHVASCAVCRARLTDAEAGRALVDAAMPKPPPKTGLTRTSPPKSRTLGWLLAAAAALALVLLVFFRGARDGGPLVVTQRSFVGTMGTGPAPSISADPRDRNVELTLEADAESALAVVCDADGRRIAADQPFAKDARGKLVVVLAPRTFAAHVGTVRVWVFAGSAVALKGAVPSAGASLVEARVREEVEARGARLAIVVLGE